jgi:anti-anti-sigma factor
VDISVAHRADNIAHICLVGKLDPYATQTMGDRFRAETASHQGPVIVDLSGVTFVTSLGIGLIIDCADTVQKRGDHMVLIPPGGHAHEVFRKTGVYMIVPAAESVEAAVAAIAGGDSGE